MKCQAAAKEGMYVYHIIRHNQSFESMKCTSQMIRLSLVHGENEFNCSATKASAIVSEVFEPIVLSQIRCELELAKFVCISTDTSSHKEIPMYPVIICYFIPLEGIKTRLINFQHAEVNMGKVGIR